MGEIDASHDADEVKRVCHSMAVAKTKMETQRFCVRFLRTNWQRKHSGNTGNSGPCFISMPDEMKISFFVVDGVN